MFVLYHIAAVGSIEFEGRFKYEILYFTLSVLKQFTECTILKND